MTAPMSIILWEQKTIDIGDWLDWFKPDSPSGNIDFTGTVITTAPNSGTSEFIDCADSITLFKYLIYNVLSIHNGEQTMSDAGIYIDGCLLYAQTLVSSICLDLENFDFDFTDPIDLLTFISFYHEGGVTIPKKVYTDSYGNNPAYVLYPPNGNNVTLRYDCNELIFELVLLD